MQFRLLPDSVKTSDGVLAATLHSAATGAPHFDLKVFTFDNGAARVKVLEKTDMSPRWEVCKQVLAYLLESSEAQMLRSWLDSNCRPRGAARREHFEARLTIDP